MGEVRIVIGGHTGPENAKYSQQHLTLIMSQGVTLVCLAVCLIRFAFQRLEQARLKTSFSQLHA